MTKVTIREVLEVIQTLDTPRGPTAVDVAALVNKNIRRQAVRHALQRAIKKGLLVRSGTKYRLASRTKILKIRRRHTIGRSKLEHTVKPTWSSKNAFPASSLSNHSSSSEETGSSRLTSVRDSLELNRHWCYKKYSSDLENSRSKSPSIKFLFPVGAKDRPSSVKEEVTNTGPLTCDKNTSNISVQPNVESSNNFSFWSFLRFW